MTTCTKACGKDNVEVGDYIVTAGAGDGLGAGAGANEYFVAVFAVKAKAEEMAVKIFTDPSKLADIVRDARTAPASAGCKGVVRWSNAKILDVVMGALGAHAPFPSGGLPPTSNAKTLLL